MADQFSPDPVRGSHSRGDAVSTLDLLAVLAVVANAAAPTYVEGTEQSLSVDLSGNLRALLAAGSSTQLNVGGTAVSAGAPLPVGLEVAGAAVAAGNPVPVNLEIGGAAVGSANAVPVKGTHTTNAAAPIADLVGVLAAIANAAAPTYTEGDGVLLSTDLAGNLRVTVAASTMTVVGNKSNNAASPDNLGLEVYPAVATTAAPAYTSGDLVALSLDTSGRLRALLDATSAPSLTANGAVVATANPLPVGLEVAGAAVAPGNPVPTNLEVGGAVVSTTNPIPTELVNRGVVRDSGQLTQATVAAGATAELIFNTAATNTAHLIEASASSSVRVKVEIQSTTLGGSPTYADKRTFIVDPIGSGLNYHPFDPSQVTAPSGSSFAMKITNLDNLLAADVYGSLAYLDF